MKRIYGLLLITLFFYNLCDAQAVVTGSTGVNATYATLSAAFTAINGGVTQTGNNILITITTDLAEPGTPTALTYKSWTTLTIKPSGARAITGVPTNQLIGLNGAKFVTIDGLNAGGNSLTVTSGTQPAFALYNGASNNTIKNLTAKANSNSLTAGIIFFSNATAGGDNNNVLDNCDITAVTSGSAVNLVYSNGATGVVNKSDTIRNCRLYDNFNATGNSNGILLDVNNDSWVVENNHFYQTAARATTSGTPVYTAININGCTGDNFKINYNSIGGTSTTHTGYTIYGPNTQGPSFKAIVLSNTGPSVAAYPSNSYVTNNTITGIQVNSNKASTVKGNNTFVGIEVNNGATTDAAYITNNTIGGYGGIYLIKIEATSTTTNQVPCAGIYNRSSKGNFIDNNFIGNISMYQTTGTAKTTSFDGIYADPTTNSTTSISYNTIGAGFELTTVYTAGRVYGIELGNTATVGTTYNVLHNTISTLTHTATGSVTVNYPLSGINCTGGGDQATIAYNTISYITLQGTFSVGDTYAAGIRAFSQTGVGAQPNRIYNNLIFYLNSPFNSNSLSGIIGISLLGNGTHYAYNNMVSIGESTSANSMVLGINQNGSNTIYLYNNSVYVQGAGGLGIPSACLRRYDNTGTINCFNNIFKMDRDGYGINFQTTPVSGTLYTGNNNIFYTPNGYAALINGSNYLFANYKASLPAGNTEGSATKEADVTFTDLPVLHTQDFDVINAGMNLFSSSPLAITDDWDGDARNACFDIGADEVYFRTAPSQLTWTGSVDTKWCTPCNWDGGVSPDSLHTVFMDAGIAQYPVIDAAHNCSATTIPKADSVNIASGATLTINSSVLEIYGQLNNSGTISNTGGSIGFASSIKDQQINSTSDLQLNDLYIKGGSTKKYLNRNTTVNTFTHCASCAADLLLGTNNLTANTSATGSLSSHIVTNSTGTLTLKSIAATAKLFPFGPDETHYNPLSITGGSGYDYTAKVETGINPGGTSNPLLGVNRTWNITASPIPSTPPNVTFMYYDADVNGACAPHNNMDLGHYYTTPIPIWDVDQAGHPVTAAAINSVSFDIANWTGTNPFIIGNTGIILALDNKILLQGNRQSNYCRLSWNIANSSNAPRFEVLRSADGAAFAVIGSLNTIAGLNDYSFIDTHPNAGKNFYRIKMMNSAGAATYSNIILLAGNDASKESIAVYPSPVRSAANIYIKAGKDQDVVLRVFDADAKLLQTSTVRLFAGDNVVPLEVTKLPAGYYFIRVNIVPDAHVIWFMKE